MELNDEQDFWAELRHSVKRADAEEVEDLAAAERMLAELEDDGSEALSDERIETMVQQATAETADRKPGRVIGFARFQRHLAAAAALFVAPKFLIAATAVTAVVVTTFVVQYSTFTLPYVDAVNIMVDEGQPLASRISSQSVVFADLLESIEMLHGVVDERTAFSSDAATQLDQLRKLFNSGGQFGLRGFRSTLGDLAADVADTGLHIQGRRDALRQLGEHLAYGALGLKLIERTSSDPDLEVQNRIWLDNLSAALSR